MFTLLGSFSEYQRLNDPPPDISKYDCRHRGRREECLIKDSSGQDCNISSSKDEEILRTPLGISEDDQSNSWNCCGKDNFKITLNSSGTFLMNTAVSVTVNFNPQLMSELELQSIDNNVSDKKSLSSSVKSVPHIPMGKYYSQDTLTLQREHSHYSRVEKFSPWHHPKASDLNRKSCSQESPAKKRVLSPRNGRSPNKRRKTFSPQKNKIYNYFVRTDGIKIENAEPCTEIEYHSLFNSNTADNMNCRDIKSFCDSKRVEKNCIEKHVETDIPDIIVISSDEDESPVSVSVKEVKEKARLQIDPNIVDLCDEPVIPSNTCAKLDQKVSDPRNLYINLSGSPVRKNIDSEVYVISSDEDNDLWISPGKAIDLTCDDLCSPDDAGGVIVPESKHFQKNPLEKDYESDDDDCISVISYQPGVLSQRERCIKECSDNDSLEEKVETENSSASLLSQKECCLKEGSDNDSLEGKIETENVSSSAKQFLIQGISKEHIKFEERLSGLVEKDGNVNCISVIRYQPGVLSQRERCIKEGSDNFSCEGKIQTEISSASLDSQRDRCIRESSDNDSLQGKFETENVSVSAHQFKITGNTVEEHSKFEKRSLGSYVSPNISRLETNSHLDDLRSKFASVHPLENEGNIHDSLLQVPDGNSTDSSLLSPPHLFEDNVSKCEKPVEENNLITLSKISDKYENNERTEFLENEVKKSVKENKSNYLETNLTLPTVKDKRIFSIDEIASQHSERKVISPSAKRVCQVQAEILLSKFCQPWIDLDLDEVPLCCESGAAKCDSVHGKKEICPEESDFFDELLLWKMDSGRSAIDLVQSRLDVFIFPTTAVLQTLLFGCMELWEEGVSEAMQWLRHLLRLHPPCAFGMLDHYKKVLINPVPKMKAVDGIFWLCVTKIEEVVNAVHKQNAENYVATKTSSDLQEGDIIEQFIQCVDPILQPEKEVEEVQEVHEINHSDKLKQLFATLDYLIRIMEADLNMGLLKNYRNLTRYTSKMGRPLIAVALWGTHSTVGNVNTKCRHLMKMYLQIFESYNDMQYHRNFRRLISLMAGVTYASERNSDPPKYPNIESNCRDLANSFASIMMASALNMTEVSLILESLAPDWFRLCVCSNLLEKLYGRNMELSLRPTVNLLKSLNELNQDYPSDEEISKTLLSEPDSNKATSRDSDEMPSSYVKLATKKDKRGETRLHIACRRNNIQEVERLLNVPDISINEKDNMGWTPLHEASFHGNVECVKRLLDFRTPSGGPAVDIQARSKGGVTPLMDAVTKNHVEVASVLLQYGGQKLLSDENGEGVSVRNFPCSEEMKCVLSNAQDHGQEYVLLTIPRTLYVKLAVLTPLAIKYYIKFSEVTRIVCYLKHNTDLTKDGTSFVKFQPIAFKQDYLEFDKLQSFLKEKSNVGKNNKLLSTLNCFT